MSTNSSKRMSILIILGTAHGADVAGKRSPDGSLREYKWSRMMCKKIMNKLREDGYRVIIDSEDVNEIGLSNRAQIVNNYCNIWTPAKVVYISIHNNAAGSQGKWMKAQGWESHVANNASQNSKKLANLMWDEAEKEGLKLRRPMPNQNYWENNFTVLTKTKCPAVLTENLFQDNKDDVAFLLSEEGKEKLMRVHVNAIEKYVDDLVGIKNEE